MVGVQQVPRKERPRKLPQALLSGHESLPAAQCLHLHRCMLRARLLEQQLIRMSKSGEGYFWIGGPGEEAFNASLGLQVKKGCGPAHDYLHLHYRNSATLLAMGMPLLDAVRQMAMTATDPHSMGRSFVGHYARRDWNVVPVSSVLAARHTVAVGTALMQKRHGGDGVTVVVGGDASTAEGDFASCLVWSSRPGQEVPVLIVVMNNGWGISTPYGQVHSERRIIDRGRAFGIPGEVVDGNDAVASWHAIDRALTFCRQERRPFLLESRVSRLFGHSSSTGCQRARTEPDCLELFERRLCETRLLNERTIGRLRQEAQAEVEQAAEQALRETRPTADDVNRFTYAPSEVDAVYPDDYTGLP